MISKLPDENRSPNVLPASYGSEPEAPSKKHKHSFSRFSLAPISSWLTRQDASGYRAVATIALGTMAINSEGLLMGLVLLISICLVRGVRSVKLPPLLACAALLWSIVGLLIVQPPWVFEGSITLVHTLISAIVFATLVRIVGTDKVLGFLLAAFGIIVAVEYLFVFEVLPYRFPTQDELGAWLGFSGHKNIASPHSAIFLIIFVWWAIQGRASIILRCWAAVALVFLANSNALTAQIALAGSVLVSVIMLLVWKYNEHFSKIILGCVSALAIATTICVTFLPTKVEETISQTLSLNPNGVISTLTGRTEIWRISLEVAAETPIVGIGYSSSIAKFDESSILQRVAREHKIKPFYHPHNGLMTVYLETGIIGLVLYLFAFFVIPAVQLVRSQTLQKNRWPIFNLWLFCLIMNGTEPFLLQRAGLGNGLFAISAMLLIIACITRDESRSTKQVVFSYKHVIEKYWPHLQNLRPRFSLSR